MTIMKNMRGTTEENFRIGVSGPTIYTGTADPSVTPPTPIDTLNVGDLYLRQGGTGEGWFYTGADWFQILVTGGTFTINDLTVNNDLTVVNQGLFADGSAAAPSISFTNNTDMGLYRVGADTIGVSASGAQVGEIAAGKLEALSQGAGDIRVALNRIGNGADEKIWSIDSVAAGLEINTRTDADAISQVAYRLTRTAGVVDTHTWFSGGSTIAVADSTSIRPSVPIHHQDGSAGAPSYSFNSDQDIGMYRPSVDQVGFAVNSTLATLITATSLVKPRSSAAPIISTRRDDAGVALMEVGHLQFNGQDDGSNPFTYSNLVGSIVDPADGSETGSLSINVGDGGSLVEHLTLTGGQVLFPDGSATTPSIGFINDPNSGFYSIADNEIGIAVNGSNIITINSTGPGIIDVTGGITVSNIITLGNIATGSLPAAGAGNLGAIAFDTTVGQLVINNNSSTWEYIAPNIGQQTIYMPAPSTKPSTTNGAAPGSFETTTNAIMIETMDFDAATEESIQFSIQMPKSWDEGTLFVQFIWSHAAATTFDVVWGIEAVAVGNDAALDAAFGTAVTVTDSGGTTDNLYYSPETAALTVGGSPGAEEVVFFRVYRDATNGSDTLDVDARLQGVRIHYTIDAGTDD